MLEHSILVAIGGPPAAAGETQHPLLQMFPMVLIFLVFYFVLFRPSQAKQKKLDALVASLKSGDQVIVNPGIFGTVVGLEADSVYVRVDEKTKIRVLKSAIADRLDLTTETEKK